MSHWNDSYFRDGGTSLCGAVNALKEKISFRGGPNGLNCAALLNELHINKKIGCYAVNKFLIPGGYEVFVRNEPKCFLDASDTDFEDAICKAPGYTFQKSFGIDTAGAFPYDDKNCEIILSTIACAESVGCLQSELPLDGSSGYASVDKLVGIKLVCKTTIIPTSSKLGRIANKTTIMHLPRMARYYDNKKDQSRVVSSKYVVGAMIEFVTSLLREYGQTSLPTSDLAKILGLSKRQTQYLISAIESFYNFQNEYSSPRLTFAHALCKPTRSDGTLGSVRSGVCVIVEPLPHKHLPLGLPPASSTDQRAVTCSGDTLRMSLGASVSPAHAGSTFSVRNLSTYELLVGRTGSAGSKGLASSDIKVLTSVTSKRAGKLFTDLNKGIGIPMERVQEGKQIIYRLVKRASDIMGDPVPPAVSAAPVYRPEQFSMGKSLTDQQKLNCSFILHYLYQVTKS